MESNRSDKTIAINSAAIVRILFIGMFRVAVIIYCGGYDRNRLNSPDEGV